MNVIPFEMYHVYDAGLYGWAWWFALKKTNKKKTIQLSHVHVQSLWNQRKCETFRTENQLWTSKNISFIAGVGGLLKKQQKNNNNWGLQESLWNFIRRIQHPNTRLQQKRLKHYFTETKRGNIKSQSNNMSDTLAQITWERPSCGTATLFFHLWLSSFFFPVLHFLTHWWTVIGVGHDAHSQRLDGQDVCQVTTGTGENYSSPSNIIQRGGEIKFRTV